MNWAGVCVAFVASTRANVVVGRVVAEQWGGASVGMVDRERYYRIGQTSKLWGR